MGDSVPFDIILLALIAGFIILRLRSVLGNKTGEERNPYQRPPAPPVAGPAPPPVPGAVPGGDNVVPLPTRAPPPVPGAAGLEPGPADAGLAQIARADRNFDPRGFLNGATAAYEMIVTSFAMGDVATLEPLLAPDVMAGFRQVIDDRKARGLTAETKVTMIRNVSAAAAQLRNSIAEVTVRFQSEIISVVRDSEGRVIEGHPAQAREVIDVWTFARDVRSPDPNWTLVATGGHA